MSSNQLVSLRHQQVLATLQAVQFALVHFVKSSSALHNRALGIMLLSTIEDAPDTIWLNMIRMTKGSFDALIEWLRLHTLFRSGRHVPEQEKLLIFLYIVCQGMTYRAAAFFFGRSEETIFRLVLNPNLSNTSSKGLLFFRIKVYSIKF